MNVALHLRRSLGVRLTRWAARHGTDTLPMTVHRRRIYIVPTRYGVGLALLLAAMLLAGLNYNSNLALAFGFLMVSLALVAMHHCHRNLLGLRVQGSADADAFAGAEARFAIVLSNASRLERRDIEIRVGAGTVIESVPARGYARVTVGVPVSQRGVIHVPHFELRTRYPFGWFRAWTYVRSQLIAYVAPLPGGSRSLPAAQSGQGDSAHAEQRGADEFAGLRAYEAGVPLKHMAWKVLARGAEAAVRTYTGPAARPEWLEWAALEGLDAESRLAQLCRWILERDAMLSAYGLRLPHVELAPDRGAAHRLACLRALACHGQTT